jgi:micrococcal nuclease
MKLKCAFLGVLLLTFIYCIGSSIKVTRVIDGDTFETETGEKVRLIGINAPEKSDIFGQDAKEYLKELIENKLVIIQGDGISRNQDIYQRLLRYVFLDGVDINKKMISDGYAFAYLKYNFSKSNEYIEAQNQAKKLNKGIWADEANILTDNNLIPPKKDPLKFYILGSIVLILLIFGIIYYIKK